MLISSREAFEGRLRVLGSREGGRLPVRSPLSRQREGVLLVSAALLLCRPKGHMKFLRWEKLGVLKDYQEDTEERMTRAMRAVARAEVGSRMAGTEKCGDS